MAQTNQPSYLLCQFPDFLQITTRPLHALLRGQAIGGGGIVMLIKISELLVDNPHANFTFFWIQNALVGHKSVNVSDVFFIHLGVGAV